jgi:hypothetical protein
MAANDAAIKPPPSSQSALVEVAWRRDGKLGVQFL